MSFSIKRMGLPLLAKELIEQSARRRTYVVRVIYSVLLYGFALLMIWQSSERWEYSNSLGMIGQGWDICEFVVGIQFVGICLFMPAICSGVITYEKERNTLGLLFLTRLGPWAIIFEKLLGRLVPMLCYLLLSIPLLAFAYALGGVSQGDLLCAIWLLSITALQVGALSVMCSALFRTTASAFVATYLIGFLMYFGLPFAREIFDLRLPFAWRGSTNIQLEWVMFGMYLFLDAARGMSAWQILGWSIPILSSIVLFLGVARVALVSLAFAPPRNLIRRLFQQFDRIFTRRSRYSDDQADLPDDHPVLWREINKRTLGKFRYQLYLCIFVETLVVLSCVAILAQPHSKWDVVEWGASIHFLLWIAPVLIICVKSASLVSSERTHQTLDTLFTTPISNREFVRQKYHSVRRFIWMLSIPFVTLFLFEIYMRHPWYGSYSSSYRDYHPIPYFFCCCLEILIYLPMVAWLSLLIGLKIRSSGRAIITALGALLAWCVVPLIILFVVVVIFDFRTNGDELLILSLFSPAAIIPINEFSAMEQSESWQAIFLNFIFYGFCTFALKYTCFECSGELLNRSDETLPGDI